MSSWIPSQRNWKQLQFWCNYDYFCIIMVTVKYVGKLRCHTFFTEMARVSRLTFAQEASNFVNAGGIIDTRVTCAIILLRLAVQSCNNSPSSAITTHVRHLYVAVEEITLITLWGQDPNYSCLTSKSSFTPTQKGISYVLTLATILTLNTSTVVYL